MQRSFVDHLLKKIAAASNLLNFACTSLVHHIRGAVITPLHNDESAKAWLMDENDVILDSILLGIEQSEVQGLADWYIANEDWFNAANIFHILALKSRGRELSQKQVRVEIQNECKK